MTLQTISELPHNLQAERSVLGAMILENDRIPDALEIVRESDFYDRRHQRVFAALRRLHERGQAVDFITMHAELEALGELEGVGGDVYLLDLTCSVPTTGHLTYHASLVRCAASARACIRAADSLREDAFGARHDSKGIDAVVDRAMEKLAAIGHGAGRRGPVPVREGLEAVLDQLCNPFVATACEFPSGFAEVDELVCGFKRGELIVIAGRPSMGKTAFALNIADHIALPVDAARRPSVLLVSMEMSRESMQARLVCARADVSARWSGGGTRSEDELESLREAGRALATANVWIDDEPAISTQTIRNRARRLRQQHGLDLIVVDYLQLIDPPSGAESRQVAISQISADLKSLARELDVPVIAVSQLSRKVEERNPPRPMLSDLRESGAIEQDADVVILLYREDYYPHLRKTENEGKAEVIVAKHRNGPTGSALVRFDATRARFRSTTVIETVPFESDQIR
ncbi:MAG: replicative DNA helicase [Planctomycetes bacterium]|nr:replicative DNA helicase [Planctomycetota bacterium]